MIPKEDKIKMIRSIETQIGSILNIECPKLNISSRSVQEALDNYIKIASIDPSDPYIYDSLYAGLKLGLVILNEDASLTFQKGSSNAE